jgi:hypothetical protein
VEMLNLEGKKEFTYQIKQNSGFLNNEWSLPIRHPLPNCMYYFPSYCRPTLNFSVAVDQLNLTLSWKGPSTR